MQHHPIPLLLGDYRDRLLPRVQAPGSGATIPLVPGTLELGLYLEEDGARRPVTDADLARWDRTLEQLLPYAASHIRRRSALEHWHRVPETDVLFFASPDGLSSARLPVLTDLIRPWPLAGALIAVPAPDLLLVQPLRSLEDVSGSQPLALAAHHVFSNAFDGLTEHLLWYDGDQFEVVEAEHDGNVTRLDPPPRFLAAVEQLAAMEFVKRPAEA